MLNKGSLQRVLENRGFSEIEIVDVKVRLVDAMIKDARKGSPVDSIDEYVDKGYLFAQLHDDDSGDDYAKHSPFKNSWTASYSLEYSYNDWNIEAIALVKGVNSPEYKEFSDRSNNWKAQFDFGGKKYKGWFKARDFNGNFIDADWTDPVTNRKVGKDWRPDMFNWAFSESNGWQYSFQCAT